MSEAKKSSLSKEIAEIATMWHHFINKWYSIPEDQRKCYETGKMLHGLPLSVYFHHVLPKEVYPEYKYCEWNIVLLSWQMHDQAEINIDKVPKVKALRDELIRKHKDGELIGCGGETDGRMP